MHARQQACESFRLARQYFQQTQLHIMTSWPISSIVKFMLDKPGYTTDPHEPEVLCYNSFAVPGTRCLHSVWLKDFSHSILPCCYLFKSFPWMCSCTCSFLQTCGSLPEQPVAKGCGKKKQERKSSVYMHNIFFPTMKKQYWKTNLLRMTRKCMVHGSTTKAVLVLTASTVLWATISGFRGGNSWGNLPKTIQNDLNTEWE